MKKFIALIIAIIGDHLELRKVSDAVCREHGLSVLENSKRNAQIRSGFFDINTTYNIDINILLT